MDDKIGEILHFYYETLKAMKNHEPKTEVNQAYWEGNKVALIVVLGILGVKVKP